MFEGRGVKNMNIISDCYNSIIDHTIEGKIYNSIEKSWQGGWQSRNKEFDNLILYSSKDGNEIWKEINSTRWVC